MPDCQLSRTRRDKHTIPYKVNMHAHRFDELTYFISGRGTTQIGGTVYSYKPKSFAFYHAHNAHDEDAPEPSDVIWTHFRYRFDGINLREGVFDDPHGELLVLLKKLRLLSLEESPHRDILTECCLCEIIITAARLQNTAAPRQAATDWQKVIDYIDENSNTEIDFPALAARFHYSYDRFRHLFREKFGISPYGYLLERRIEHAEYLLINTSSRLIDIAYDCGFGSSSQFANIFKKHTGMTPGQYRNQKSG